MFTIYTNKWWDTHDIRTCINNQNLYIYIYTYIVPLLEQPQADPSQLAFQHLRARIAGAKKACQSNPSTHVRQSKGRVGFGDLGRFRFCASTDLIPQMIAMGYQYARFVSRWYILRKWLNTYLQMDQNNFLALLSSESGGWYGLLQVPRTKLNMYCKNL